MIFNPAYTVTIASFKDSPGSPHVNIQAPMPEQFMYDVSSMYEAPFTQGLTGNAMIDTMMRVGFAAKLVMHSMTAQFWQGSTETELGLELEFHAESDPRTEVIQPIVQLVSLATPTTNSLNLLSSPGPKVEGQVLQDLVTMAKTQKRQVPTGTQGEVSSGQLTDTNQSSTQGSMGPASTANTSTNIGSVQYFKSRIQDQITIQVGKYAYFDSVVITNVQKTYESQFDAVTGLPFFAKVAIRFKPLFMITQDDLNKIFGMGNSSPIVPTNPVQNLGTSGLTR